MVWHIKHEQSKDPTPWAVYLVTENEEVPKKFFGTKERAEKWIQARINRDKRVTGACGTDDKKVIDSDPIDEASKESFPSSDPPAWTSVITK